MVGMALGASTAILLLVSTASAQGRPGGGDGGFQGRRPQALARLSDTDQERFDDGFRDFAQNENVNDGLGPVFNGRSCAECHARPLIGGSSNETVVRFGLSSGATFDPLDDLGGSLRQARGIDTPTCSVDGEVVPDIANEVTRRITPPVYGMGLIDAIPEKRILRKADPDDRNGDGISGRPNMVNGQVGRFGWKAQVATLIEFTADAYLNEMGITSPLRPNEVNPQGGPVVCDTVPDPEDDGTDVQSLTDFMAFLAPLDTGPRTREVRQGKRYFRKAKCHKCHIPSLRTGPSETRALRNKRARLYSDLLLHDMGSELADGIEQGEATGSEFRTAPLWGVRANGPWLHDGRARSLRQAILEHGGEAQDSRDRFADLPRDSQDALIEFLQSL